MENISSALEMTPNTVEVRVLYKDGTGLAVPQIRNLSPFFDKYTKHYLAVETNKGWVVCFADIGSASGVFRNAIVFESIIPQDAITSIETVDEHFSDVVFVLKALLSFDTTAQDVDEWHIGNDEKNKRHVYLFQKLRDGDRACFCDWEIAVSGWNEDRLRQIRAATFEAIINGRDVKRLFVVPKDNAEVLALATEEAKGKYPEGPQNLF